MAQTTGRTPTAVDVRDVLHVAGWCDKAFRYLAAHAGAELPDAGSEPFDTGCIFRGRRLWLTETAEELRIAEHGEVRYNWRKGQDWPEVAAAEFWLR
jgi:hypothetical protein